MLSQCPIVIYRKIKLFSMPSCASSNFRGGGLGLTVSSLLGSNPNILLITVRKGIYGKKDF